MSHAQGRTGRKNWQVFELPRCVLNAAEQMWTGGRSWSMLKVRMVVKAR